MAASLLCLYGNNILAYLSSPALKDTPIEYGKIAGYKVDINKSVVMPELVFNPNGALITSPS